MTTSIRTATYLALTTALISGVSIFINKLAVTGVSDPVLFSGLKNAIVAIFLAGILLMLGKRTEVMSLKLRSWGTLGVIGFIGGALPFALFFTGLAMVPAVTGALIHKTMFVWVALLAVVFLHERFSPLQWLGVGALFVANLVVGGFGGLTGSLGELLMFGATLLWAVEHIIAKRALASISTVTVAGARMLFGSFFLIAFLALTGRMSGLGALTYENLAWTLLTAVFLLGYTVSWYAALKRAPASYVSALLVPATLVTNILSAIYITGTLTEEQVLQGFLLVLGGVLVVIFARQSTPHAVPAMNTPLVS